MWDLKWKILTIVAPLLLLFTDWLPIVFFLRLPDWSLTRYGWLWLAVGGFGLLWEAMGCSGSLWLIPVFNTGSEHGLVQF